MAEREIMYYKSSHKILLVGEGDFSFSACLAKAFGNASNMLATSLDSLEFLTNNYEDAVSNITEIQQRFGNVILSVDATEMAKHESLRGKKFDRIVFNFPHASINHLLSRKEQVLRNQKLVYNFFKNAERLLSDEGEIHVVHKCYGFFLEWQIVGLGILSDLRPLEEVYFSLSDYPGYSNKYGSWGNDSFNCSSSKTYKFSKFTVPQEFKDEVMKKLGLDLRMLAEKNDTSSLLLKLKEMCQSSRSSSNSTYP